MPPKSTRGGKRAGSGRKPVLPRCACGRHTLARAVKLRLKCRNVDDAAFAKAESELARGETVGIDKIKAR